MNERLTFFLALFCLRLYPPILLYLQELPEGPSSGLTWRLCALLVPACGNAALALGLGRVRHQLSVELCCLSVLIVSDTDLSLIGFCLAHIGLLVLSVRYQAVRLCW